MKLTGRFLVLLLCCVILSINSQIYSFDETIDDVAYNSNADEQYTPRSTLRFGGIYWKTYVDGLEYAIFNSANQVITPAGQNVILDNDYELKEVSQNPHGGFEIGLNHIVSRDFWSVDALFTYYRCHGRDGGNRIEIPHPAGVSSIVGRDTNDIWSIHSIGDDTDTIEGFIKTRYMTFDIVFNKDQEVSEHFLLSAAFGIKIAQIDERLAISFGDPGSPYIGKLNNSVMNIRNDFKGVGPTVVFAPRFLLDYGFSFGGRVALSALYGRFNLDQNQKFVDNSNSGDLFTFQYVSTLRKKRIQPSLNFVLSVDWEYNFSAFSVGTGIGYEINYWTNFIRQERISNSITAQQNFTTKGKNIQQRHGDLALHGLVITWFIEF